MDHLGLVRSFALQYAQPGVPVEETDMYQEAIIALIKAAKTYDPSVGSAFSTWAYKIIRNHLLNILRKNRSEEICLPSAQDIPSEQPQTSSLELVNEILQPQPTDDEEDIADREILVRHFLKGETWAALGRELGVSREWVRQRGERAIQKIKQRFKIDEF